REVTAGGVAAGHPRHLRGVAGNTGAARDGHGVVRREVAEPLPRRPCLGRDEDRVVGGPFDLEPVPRAEPDGRDAPAVVDVGGGLEAERALYLHVHRAGLARPHPLRDQRRERDPPIAREHEAVGRDALPEAGGPGEDDVVERLAALERGGDEDAEVVLDLLLPDELVEGEGAEGLLEVLVAADGVGGAAGGGLLGHGGRGWFAAKVRRWG